MPINFIEENERYKIIKVPGHMNDDNPSIVKIQKFTMEGWALIEDNSLEGIKEGDKLKIKFNTGSIKLAKLKAGLVEIDNKKVNDEMINRLPVYSREIILTEIEKFNNVEAMEKN